MLEESFGRNRLAIHPKETRETLFPCDPKRAVQLATKGGEIDLKLLRAIMIVVILATALSFGACAQHKEATVTTSAGTTGYAK